MTRRHHKKTPIELLRCRYLWGPCRAPRREVVTFFCSLCYCHCARKSCSRSSRHRSFVRSLARSFIRSFVHSFVPSSSFVRSFVCSFLPSLRKIFLFGLVVLTFWPKLPKTTFSRDQLGLFSGHSSGNPRTFKNEK